VETALPTAGNRSAHATLWQIVIMSHHLWGMRRRYDRARQVLASGARRAPQNPSRGGKIAAAGKSRLLSTTMGGR
jgi:hypothetical protein